MNTEMTQLLTELSHQEAATVNGGGSRRRYLLGNYWYSKYVNIWNSINDWDAKRQRRWADSFNTFNSWN
jgi:hypothetical protein